MGWYNKYLLPYLVDSICRHQIVTDQRLKVVPHATGKVLEIGAGSGLNLPLYNPKEVTAVIELEPSFEIWNKCTVDLDQLAFPVQYIQCSAEQLPFEQDTFDSVVSTFTLCSIPDINRALREINRVLKPTGSFFFSEHGLSPHPPVFQWQQRLNPIWKTFSGGCQLNRNIPEVLIENGFRIEQMETLYLPGWKPATYNFWGKATPLKEF